MREPSAAVQKALAVTAEVCGAELTAAAVDVMLADLSEYPEVAVLDALKRVRREHKGRLVLAAIIERIDDGRPGVEVAWAMVPRSERDTAVLTTEMLHALSAAQPLLDEGDEIAARMAFKEAYTKVVELARANGVSVRWQASIGWDANGRAAPLGEAVRIGRLSLAQAEQYVTGEALKDMLELAGVTSHPALAAPKPLPPAVAAVISAPKRLPEDVKPDPPAETDAERIARIDTERARIKRMLDARGITEHDMQAARRAHAEGAGDAA